MDVAAGNFAIYGVEPKLLPTCCPSHVSLTDKLYILNSNRSLPFGCILFKFHDNI